MKTTGVIAADVSLFLQLMDAVMNRHEVTFGAARAEPMFKEEIRQMLEDLR